MKNSLNWINFYNPTDDWYYISENERKTYINKYNEIIKYVKNNGGKLIGSYKSRSNSEWSRYEIWEFPSVEMIVEMNNQLEEIGHYQYFEENHVIGRKYIKDIRANKTNH